MIYWAITRVMGAMLGFAPAPEARFKFLVICTLVPEVPVAGMLASWVAKRRQ